VLAAAPLRDALRDTRRGAAGGGSQDALERCADLRDGSAQIAQHELRVHAHHAIAETLELAIATRIRAATTRVIAAVHLDDEPDARSEKVHDEAPTEDDLRTELHAQLARLERRPQARLRLGEARAVLPSLELEPSLRFRSER
jgi:hypothetical protein